jgi:hypothetical protein
MKDIRLIMEPVNIIACAMGTACEGDLLQHVMSKGTKMPPPPTPAIEANTADKKIKMVPMSIQ